MLNIADSADISSLAHIEESQRGTLIEIGERVYIDSFVRIRPVGGDGNIVIGDDCFINAGTVIFSGNGVQIGKWVLIAPNCTIVPTNHEMKSANTTIRHQGFLPSKGGIVIEDDVWIGANTTILDGAQIRQGAVIGAGSLVTKEVAPYTVNVGNPLRQVGVRGR